MKYLVQAVTYLFKLLQYILLFIIVFVGMMSWAIIECLMFIGGLRSNDKSN